MAAKKRQLDGRNSQATLTWQTMALSAAWRTAAIRPFVAKVGDGG